MPLKHYSPAKLHDLHPDFIFPILESQAPIPDPNAIAPPTRFCHDKGPLAKLVRGEHPRFRERRFHLNPPVPLDAVQVLKVAYPPKKLPGPNSNALLPGNLIEGRTSYKVAQRHISGPEETPRKLFQDQDGLYGIALVRRK